MAASAFGVFLHKLRENRGLSLRELAQLSAVDHAYIYRLETGAKESPSDEVLGKLIRALKAMKREADMLRHLAKNPNVSVGLAEYALEDQTVTLDELAAAAGVAYRGPTRRDFKTVIERVRRILGDEDGG
jgi:transcriptional regulator with XRE-family HTH domain